MNVNLKHFFYWGVGGLALIALAGPYPDLATLFVLILIVGVLLHHYKEYMAMLGNVTPPTVKKQG
jgi:hypothetical protein